MQYKKEAGINGRYCSHENYTYKAMNIQVCKLVCCASFT